jgi:hypothetical protein
MKLKKIIVVPLLIVLLISGLSCGGKETINPLPKPTATPGETSGATASPAGGPTPTPTPSATPVLGSEVEIHRIAYQGTGFREADEYVSIRNTGNESLNLYGWILKDITDGYPTFQFPHHVLGPGGLARVYTNEKNIEWDRLSFESKDPVWNNTHPDTAALYNNFGQLVSTRSYTPE